MGCLDCPEIEGNYFEAYKNFKIVYNSLKVNNKFKIFLIKYSSIENFMELIKDYIDIEDSKAETDLKKLFRENKVKCGDVEIYCEYSESLLKEGNKFIVVNDTFMEKMNFPREEEKKVEIDTSNKTIKFNINKELNYKEKEDETGIFIFCENNKEKVIDSKNTNWNSKVSGVIDSHNTHFNSISESNFVGNNRLANAESRLTLDRSNNNVNNGENIDNELDNSKLLLNNNKSENKKKKETNNEKKIEICNENKNAKINDENETHNCYVENNKYVDNKNENSKDENLKKENNEINENNREHNNNIINKNENYEKNSNENEHNRNNKDEKNEKENTNSQNEKNNNGNIIKENEQNDNTENNNIKINSINGNNLNNKKEETQSKNESGGFIESSTIKMDDQENIPNTYNKDNIQKNENIPINQNQQETKSIEGGFYEITENNDELKKSSIKKSVFSNGDFYEKESNNENNNKIREDNNDNYSNVNDGDFIEESQISN